MDSENLGPAEPWQIRAFPSGLRQRLVDEAHTRRESVGDLLTRIVVAWFDAPNNAPNVDMGIPISLTPPIDTMPQWLRAALWRRVAGQMGIEAPRSVRKKPLTPPTLSAPAENPRDDE